MLAVIRRIPWKAKEAVFITALMTLLGVCFPDEADAFAVLSIIVLFAIEDLWETALRIAIKERMFGQAKEDEHLYLILPRCPYKLLVLRQVLVLGEAKLAQARQAARKTERTIHDWYVPDFPRTGAGGREVEPMRHAWLGDGRERGVRL